MIEWTKVESTHYSARGVGNGPIDNFINTTLPESTTQISIRSVVVSWDGFQELIDSLPNISIINFNKQTSLPETLLGSAHINLLNYSGKTPIKWEHNINSYNPNNCSFQGSNVPNVDFTVYSSKSRISISELTFDNVPAGPKNILSIKNGILKFNKIDNFGSIDKLWFNDCNILNLIGLRNIGKIREINFNNSILCHGLFELFLIKGLQTVSYSGNDQSLHEFISSVNAIIKHKTGYWGLLKMLNAHPHLYDDPSLSEYLKMVG